MMIVVVKLRNNTILLCLSGPQKNKTKKKQIIEWKVKDPTEMERKRDISHF